MNKERQKQEAIERMKLLELYPNIIKEFEKDGILNMSESEGFLYWLNSDEQAIVDDFENKHNALVYHVIHNYTEFGELYSLLYISENENEWGYDKDDLKNGIALAYVKNVNTDWCSEFGSISIKPQFGGLIRTA